MKANPDLVYAVTESPGTAATLIEQADFTGLSKSAEITGSQEFGQPAVSENISDPTLLNGIKFVSTWLGEYSELQVVQDFRDKMAERGHADPFFTSAYWHDMIYIIKTVYEQAQSTNTDDVANAMKDLSYGPGVYSGRTYTWDGDPRPSEWAVFVAQWDEDGSQSVFVRDMNEWFENNR